MTAPNIIPEIKLAPPEGELLYVNPYTKEWADIDMHGDIQITHDYSGLIYDLYPPTYNVKGGILYVDQRHDDVLTMDIGNSIDTSTEPSDLKNTKSNIRTIKQDNNSKLKRI